MKLLDYIARIVITTGLWVAGVFPFLRRWMVPVRAVVTRLLYKRPAGDYLKHLSSIRYKSPHVVLVQAPGWGVDTPPLAIACLTAFLRANGIKVMPVDINVEMYNKNKHQYPDGWSNNVFWFWDNPSTLDAFINDNKEALEQYIELIANSGARIIGFTIFDSSYRMSAYMAREIKKRNPALTVVFGGAGASGRITGRSIIKENDSIDFVVEGEGEETFLEIVKLVNDGKDIVECKGATFKCGNAIVPVAPRAFIKNLDTLPFPDFTDFNFFRYREPFKCPIESCRGCINKCVFCNERAFWGGYRFRSGNSLYDEMRYQIEKHPHISYFEFHDSLINGNITEIERLCDNIIRDRLNVFWGGQAVVRKEMTYELLVKFKKAGCVSLAYGLESTSKPLLKKVGKIFTAASDIDRLVRDSYRAGVGCGLNFMFGLPGETDDDAEENINFIRRNAKYIYAINPSSAFCLIHPGTAAYAEPENYRIDISKGASYWESSDGKNNYLKRLERFERFVSEVQRLKIPCVYPYPRLLNHSELIADYYYHIGEYGKAIPYYKESIEKESETKEKIEKLNHCYELVPKN
ncbi:MAG: cobalamin B12-binding domain-containing protein [Deltaproteobacteria bacterium]|nr:cobalamin B12-binding domain-containing protein [Deltaproteobacteria bacterium]